MKKQPENLETVAVSVLIPYARNSRTHSESQVSQIAASIREFGFTNPVLIDSENGIIAGHGRVLAAQKLGLDTVPAIRIDYMTDAQKRAYIIADNKLALNAGWDDELLALELGELRDMDFDLTLTGFDAGELDIILTDDPENDNTPKREANGVLAERFLIPPFSVFNARDGWWQDRKKKWLSLGIKSESGRGNSENGGGLLLMKGIKADDPNLTEVQRRIMEVGDTTSIFDPVLCEIAYRWFCPPGGLVLDPFAGGSVRGIIAAKLGREYIGHELRAEQVAANRQQAAEICADDGITPAWIEGDSRKIDQTCADVAADFLFSCPPYVDLEVYSDDPADISTMKYPEFRDVYFEIIAKSCEKLRENRFACFVVGEVRDKRGNYYDFVGDTVEAFRAAGLHYYNEGILVTTVGSLPVRIGRAFSGSRKWGKTHQNVLVFVKGDAKRAAEACGEVVVDIEDQSDEAA